MTSEQFFHLLKDQIQIAALSFMALMYAIKVWGLMKKNVVKDRTPDHGDPNAGMRYSLASIAMPWEMESYRNRPIKYVEFAVFHIGIAVAITSTLIIPYWPEFMLIKPILIGSQIAVALALVAGLLRLIARVSSPVMRLISNPDDYFSILLLNTYLASAFFALPNSAAVQWDWTIVTFFGLTTFFLIYVPFSKICHYLLWPFNRYYVGKHFGKRGVYPKQPGSFSPSQS